MTADLREYDGACYDRKFTGVSAYLKNIKTKEEYPALIKVIHTDDDGYVTARIQDKDDKDVLVELPTDMKKGKSTKGLDVCIPVYKPIESRWYPINLFFKKAPYDEVLIVRKARRGFYCGLSRGSHYILGMIKDRDNAWLQSLDFPVKAIDWINAPDIQSNPHQKVIEGWGVLDNVWSITPTVVYYLDTEVGLVKGTNIFMNTPLLAKEFNRLYGHIWKVNSL